ncbi:hypothetical protein ACHAO2_004228 [Verticillium nonalfalfae]
MAPPRDDHLDHPEYRRSGIQESRSDNADAGSNLEVAQLTVPDLPDALLPRQAPPLPDRGVSRRQSQPFEGQNHLPAVENSVTAENVGQRSQSNIPSSPPERQTSGGFGGLWQDNNNNIDIMIKTQATMAAHIKSLTARVEMAEERQSRAEHALEERIRARDDLNEKLRKIENFTENLEETKKENEALKEQLLDAQSHIFSLQPYRKDVTPEEVRRLDHRQRDITAVKKVAAMDFEKLAISERKIIVGIDFGTTYSGVAWAETQRPDRRTTITSWPVSKTIREGESSDKVPTKLRYTKGDVQWGFSIPVTAPQNEVVEWFKLDIDPTLQDMGNTVAKEARAGRSVDELVTDFISALGEHLRYTLQAKLGGHIVSTIPLEVGDTIVVVDAGGGTVDLISYTITRLKPILEVQEAAPGSGALCGSTFLNLRFRKFLTSKLGSEEGFDDEVLAEALDVFEKKIKRQFTMQAGPGDTFIVPVGGLANNKELGISRGRFSLKVADLQTIFEPVILECIKLVSAQIAASGVPISAVLLVGGFGASNYLKERIRNAIDRKIQILQPPNAWQAVVQGAVMKGLAQASPSQLTQVRIQNRRARKHYGTQWRTRYEERQHGHLRDKRHWCGLDGCYKVYTMEYMVRRGDAVSETDAYYVSFVWTGLVSQGRIKKVKMDIYADGTSSVAPVARNDNTKLLCHVEADVSHIPESQLDRRQGNDGEAYYELECKIEARFHSASTEYTLLYNNQRYNTVTAEYV